jgi:hypothetical protein
MTLTNNLKLTGQKISGVVPEAALIEPGADEAESVPVTLTAATLADSSDWTYSATAEDAGTAGILDGQPGVTYSGPGGVGFRVTVNNFDTIEHAISPGEAADTAVMALYVNSDLVAYADEGFTTHAAEIAVEFNVDTYVQLDENDVLRVGVAFSGEEAVADLDLAAGEINIS